MVGTISTHYYLEHGLQPDSCYSLQGVYPMILYMVFSYYHMFGCTYSCTQAAKSITYRYVWITPGFNESWWIGPNDTHCSDSNLHIFLHEQGVLSISNTLSGGVLTNCGSGSNVC